VASRPLFQADPQAVYRPSTGRLQAVYRPSTGRLQAVYRPSTGCVQAVYRPSTGRLQAVYRLCAGRLQAVYRLGMMFTVTAQQFDPAPFRFHAVQTHDVKNLMVCTYAQSRSLACSFVGDKGKKHYHCLRCAYTTYSSENVRKHFGKHDKQDLRGLCL
jgi:alpha-D-ribose 1-methylphosphonate 5-phosphate C-P lyase